MEYKYINKNKKLNIVSRIKYLWAQSYIILLNFLCFLPSLRKEESKLSLSALVLAVDPNEVDFASYPEKDVEEYFCILF